MLVWDLFLFCKHNLLQKQQELICNKKKTTQPMKSSNHNQLKSKYIELQQVTIRFQTTTVQLLLLLLLHHPNQKASNISKYKHTIWTIHRAFNTQVITKEQLFLKWSRTLLLYPHHKQQQLWLANLLQCLKCLKYRTINVQWPLPIPNPPKQQVTLQIKLIKPITI